MRFNSVFALVFACASASSVTAATLSVEVTNLTHGTYFAPLMLSAHATPQAYYDVGHPATEAIQAMAEGGDISGLLAESETIGAVTLANPAEGMLAPGGTVMVEAWDVQSQGYLTLTGMLVPSNDGFVGLNSFPIPTEAGTYTLMLNAYDAGTEANDEIVNGGGAPGVAGIPGNPGMNGGANATGVTQSESNATVHIHRGILGDTDAEGGPSDLDARIHRWLNPVAKLTLTVHSASEE